MKCGCKILCVQRIKSSLTTHLSVCVHALQIVLCFIYQPPILIPPAYYIGQYGPVYRATLNRHAGVEVDVVAKSIRKSLARRVEFNSYMHELSILVKNKHTNVANIYGIVDESECDHSLMKLSIFISFIILITAKVIVMKYFPLGNLKTFLKVSVTNIDSSSELPRLRQIHIHY